MTAFSICTRKYYSTSLQQSSSRGLSDAQGQYSFLAKIKKKLLLQLLLIYVENLPKQTKLLEFSRDTNWEELKTRKKWLQLHSAVLIKLYLVTLVNLAKTFVANNIKWIRLIWRYLHHSFPNSLNVFRYKKPRWISFSSS